MKDNSRDKVRVWPTALLGMGAAIGIYACWKLIQHAGRKARLINLPDDQQILILGAGFAGTNVARELAKLLPDPEQVRITVINEDNFMLFTPMLTEAAGGEIEARFIASPLRDLLPERINFEQGHVEQIDLAQKRVVLSNRSDRAEPTQVLTADHLVIALGSVPNFHDLPGVKENSFTIKKLSDATTIRNHALQMLERADAESDEKEQQALLTFIVAGGGYTGVETMAAINDLIRAAARNYPQVKTDNIHTTIIEPEDRLLPELSADLATYAQKKLEARKIKLRLKTKITGAGKDYVEVEGGERIRSRTFIWAGGVTPGPIIGQLDCKRGKHGGIVVEETCAVPGRPGVWAIGDCAEIPQSHSKESYAPTAQNATREGVLVARNIVAALSGTQPQPFTYRPIGELALVGRYSGVARIYGFNFSGLIAWAMWRVVYLAKMPRTVQRVRILLDWLLDFAFGRPLAALPAAEGVSRRAKHA